MAAPPPTWSRTWPVESTATAAAEMASKLSSEYKWCVTGTPISSGMEDLYGLVLFLSIEPWSHKRVWNAILKQGGKGWPMLQMLLDRVMWRSTKHIVGDELQLPDQTHTRVNLQLSAVEREFYAVVEKECTSTAR